jgi:nucleotide-binding universal stress UspA family protein
MVSQNPSVDPWPSPTVDAAAAVLVGVDGSENSWCALSWACGEARRLRGRAVAVFVSSSAESGLRRELECYAADHDVDLSFVHIDGDVASELLRLATELHADQIVVGRSMKARHRLAASVGCRLVGTRKAPVVVVVP